MQPNENWTSIFTKEGIQIYQKKKNVLKDTQLYNHVWWCTPIIPALERLRQKDHKFKASLGYIA
jgi:hypothetical protein